jgi:hypothetical protein
MPKHLFRTVYRTDATDDEPEYKGMFSETLPDSAFWESQIVHVDWSERGWVEVTYLVEGRSTIS